MTIKTCFKIQHNCIVSTILIISMILTSARS
nr:MAG TPA: hypothetical protein [Caudoviricetes sp.]